MAYVNLSKMPDPKREYTVNFDTLAGGLNLQELDYRIGNNESPEMKNLMWREGVLSCRDGQTWVKTDASGAPVSLGTFHASYDRIWNGYMFVHANNKIYAVDPESGDSTLLYTAVDNTMAERGKFFPYNEKLYYKTHGFYVVIEYDWLTHTFSASDVEGYVPVTYINCTPINGSGTVYQPENRLSASKTLWYNASYTLTASPSEGLSVSIESSYFRMKNNTPGTYVFTYDGTKWELNSEEVDPLDYGITVGGTPQNGSTITVVYRFINEYYLPLSPDSIDDITVDGIEQTEESAQVTVSREALTVTFDKSVWRGIVTVSGTYEFIYDYDALPEATWELDGVAVDLADYGLAVTAGSPVTDDKITVVYVRGNFWLDQGLRKVTFFVAPPVTYPETNNTVHITYSKSNELAYSNIMDCLYAEVYGGTGALCIVMAGSLDQPNAYFWNGQTSISMDASYFPMTQYQLAGDGTDPVTGFGKQQGYLIIFKERSVGRTSLSTATVNDRTTIDLPYTAINAKIGCDLPYTIQLVENNLTWCNTDRGVHFLANTSSAYENNVVCLSDKVNDQGSSWNAGLLYDVRSVIGEAVSSMDDEKRYWLVVNGHVWLWDYYISNYKNPSWFFFDNINGLGFVQEHDSVWHFDALTRLTHFERVYFDYDPSTDPVPAEEFSDEATYQVGDYCIYKGDIYQCVVEIKRAGDWDPTQWILFNPTGPGAIDKVLRFATQYFGTYDNYKTVNSVIINTRSDTDSVIDLTYMTDYEVRGDLTPLVSVAWRLVPRNLEKRNLSGSGFAHSFRRKAHCRRIQYFTMKMENNTPGMDMSVVSAQIFYTYQGRQR